MNIIKATKKPITIEAVLFNDSTKNMVYNWVAGNKSIGFDDSGNPTLGIQTLEGVITASCGDYIIKGVSGEFYPCKPDIFKLTYDIDGE